MGYWSGPALHLAFYHGSNQHLFVITDLDPSCDVVLGMNWLYQHNLLAPDAVELLQDILQIQYRAIARLIVITIVFDYFALARLLVMTI